MTTFDKREEGFEKKFAHDEELRFKANARRNKLLGLWAAEKLGTYRRCGERLRQGSRHGRLRGSRRRRRVQEGAARISTPRASPRPSRTSAAPWIDLMEKAIAEIKASG